MWEPVDITAMPTANELIDAKIAIEQMEIKLKDALLSLEQAQPRVANIEKNLKKRRAWIAPVRRLSYDIISLIFELCGEDDWRTPLRIAAVSRQWRNSVLATPRAWAFLHVDECDGEQDLINHFFKHSGHQTLHVVLSKSQRYTLISSVVERLKCLSIEDSSHIEERQCFPRLARLCIRSAAGSVAIKDLSISRFPAQSVLICEPKIIGAIISPPSSMQATFPPLQVLSVVMLGGLAWLDLLSGFQSSLVSLRLHFVNEGPDSKPEVFLPKLRCLEIMIWADYPAFWPINLKTPAIETYIEGTEFFSPLAGTALIHRNTGNVTRARIFYAADLSAMSSLHTLQLQSSVHIAYVLSQLQLNPSLCPRLEFIEVLQAADQAPYETSLVEVNRERAQPISIRKVETWVTALPYEIS